MPGEFVTEGILPLCRPSGLLQLQRRKQHLSEVQNGENKAPKEGETFVQGPFNTAGFFAKDEALFLHDSLFVFQGLGCEFSPILKGPLSVTQKKKVHFFSGW